jgi:tetratricopeptide (TPR) repeat protein
MKMTQFCPGTTLMVLLCTLLSNILTAVPTASAQLPQPALPIPADPPRPEQQRTTTTGVTQQNATTATSLASGTAAAAHPTVDYTTADIPSSLGQLPELSAETLRGGEFHQSGALDRQDEKDLRFRELHERLSSLIQRHADAAAMSAQPPVPHTENPSTSEVPAEHHTEAHAEHGDESHAEHGAASPSEPPDIDLPVPTEAIEIPTEAVQTPADQESSPLQLPPIIQGPIDRVGLADNLFALGEYLIALEMYSQIDAEKFPPAELVWIKYQSAGCLRRLHRIPEAQEQYRRLAAQHEVPWLATMSRWWLDRIDDRVAATDELDRYRQLLDVLKEPQHEIPGN